MIDKITETELNNVSVESVQGEKLIGSATENKKVFDKMGRFLAAKINALIDAVKDVPIGPGSITEDYLANTVREKLELHAESDHTHKNKNLLDTITEDNLVNEMGIGTRQYTVKGTNGKAELIVTDQNNFMAYLKDNSDNILNSMKMNDTYASFEKPLDVNGGGTGSSVKRVSASNLLKANDKYCTSISSKRGWFIPYMDMVFFGFSASVKVPAGEFVKIAEIQKLPIVSSLSKLPAVPMALTVSNYSTTSLAYWKGKIKTDGSIEVACEKAQTTAVTIYVSGFYFTE